MAADLKKLPDVRKPDIDRCVQKPVYEKTFSAASVLASVGGEVYHRAFYGSAVQPPPLRKIGHDALFDLASLTKPLATGLAALYLASRSRIDLGAPLSSTLPEFRDKRFDKITLDMLLDHSSGFPRSRSYWERVADHDAKVPSSQAMMGKPDAVQFIKEEVAKTTLEADPGTQEIYSDIGFMVLGWVIEGIVGKPLNVFLEREIYRPLGLHEDLFFIPLEDTRFRQRLGRRTFVATEECPWRDRLLQGEVHDRNAYALGGLAGHAGLFGTGDAVWRLVHTLWACANGEDRTFLSGTVRRFWTRSKRIRNTTRALAWDTPSTNDSMAGKRFSRNAIGHLSNTGCSIWVDMSSNIIGVVLANSPHPSPENKDEAMKAFRPRVYELIAKEGESLDGPQGARGSAAFLGR